MTKSRKRGILLISLSLLFAFAVASFVVMKPASADTEVVSIKESAQIAFYGEKSIKFTGSASESLAYDADTYAGVLVAKAELSASELTAETKDVINIPATNYVSANGKKEFSAVVSDIAEEDYSKTYTARAYVCDNGEYTYSANVVQRTFTQIASKVFAEDFETLLFEERAELRAIVEKANPVVKVNGQVLDDSIENVVSIVAGEQATITVEPANLTLFVNAEKDNKTITLTGNKIGVGKTAIGVADYIYVDIGAKFYMIAVNTGYWHDPSLANTNVIANFNSAKALASIIDGTANGAGFNTSIDYVAKDSEEGKAIGATSGVAKVNAEAWDVADFKLRTPTKVSEFSGAYIKFKMPEAFEFDSMDKSNGIMYIRVNEVSRAVAYTMLRSYVKTAGGWNTLAFTNYDLRKNFGLTDDSVIETFGLMPVYKGCTYYVDEVGFYSEKDSTIVNSFDGPEQNGLVWNRYVDYKWRVTQPGDDDYPVGLAGATSGLLTITPISGHGCPIHVTPSQLIPTKNLTKIKARLYVPANDSFPTNTYLRFNFSFNEPYNNNNQAQVVLRADVVRGKWNDIEFTVNTNTSNTFTSDYIYAMALYKVIDSKLQESWIIEETPWYLDYIQGVYA
jgi:hypothetical protein